MAQRGGYRVGAGRKPGLRAHIQLPKVHGPIRVAELMLADALPELVELAIKLALEGDRALVAYCIDRVLGKAVQPIDVSKRIQDIAAAEGLTEEEAAEAVAEVQRMMAVGRGARS